MKIARFFSVIFAVLGCVLLVGSMLLCLISRNDQVHVLEVPKGAVDCSDTFAGLLKGGDLAAAEKMIYGQPDLGLGKSISDPETAMVWDAFRSEISFSYTGKCYAVENGFARDATITTADITAALQKLPEYTQQLIDRKIASAARLEDIYDEDGHFHQELADQILQSALNQTMTQDVEMVSRDVTIKLVNRDGGWWVMPDQTLLQAISGLA